MKSEHDVIRTGELDDVTGGRGAPTYAEYSKKFATGFVPCEVSAAYDTYQRWLATRPTTPRK